jgi:hypothetical protein
LLTNAKTDTTATVTTSVRYVTHANGSADSNGVAGNDDGQQKKTFLSKGSFYHYVGTFKKMPCYFA